MEQNNCPAWHPCDPQKEHLLLAGALSLSHTDNSATAAGATTTNRQRVRREGQGKSSRQEEIPWDRGEVTGQLDRRENMCMGAIVLVG